MWILSQVNIVPEDIIQGGALVIVGWIIYWYSTRLERRLRIIERLVIQQALWQMRDNGASENAREQFLNLVKEEDQYETNELDNAG